MGKYTVLTGKMADSLLCLEDNFENYIVTKCTCCGKIQETLRVSFRNRYNKTKNSSIVYCKNKDCKFSYKKDGRYKNGHIYNNMIIISYNDNHTYTVKCNGCGRESVVQTYCLSDNSNHCKNINCNFYFGKNHRSNNDIIGVVKHNLKVLGYSKDSNGKVCISVKCLDCGEDFGIRNISQFKNGNCACINKFCKNYKANIKYKGKLEGKQFNRIKVIKELEKSKLLVECVKCGSTQEVLLNNGVTGLNSILCKNSTCMNSLANPMSCIGRVIGDFTIIDRVAVDNFTCRCNICQSLTTVNSLKIGMPKRCSNHPRRDLYKGMVFYNFSILKYEFTYKDLDYFTCQCQKCGKKDILNVKQMLEHRCQD